MALTPTSWPAAALSLAAALLVCRPVAADERLVADAHGLERAVREAKPGDTITLAPGDYAIERVLRAAAAGTDQAPITLRARQPGEARLLSRVHEALVIAAPWWTVENLDIKGACKEEAECEHAIHIVGDADHAVIRANRLHDFNAAIKANGSGPAGARVFPDDVLVEDNDIFNTAPRNTGSTVATIDVVGGRRWRVRDNLIADFGKSGGNEVAYGAFLKGNSRDGVFERNLVVCSWRHKGGERIGLSFGGGGVTNPLYCEDGDCTRMHVGGIMRNNVVANCSDVGIYLNRSADTRIYNNLLYATNGLDVRYPVSSADIRNNILSGRLRSRDGGVSSASANIGQPPELMAPERGDFRPGPSALVRGRGVALAEVTDDFCGHPRKGSFDLGPFQPDGKKAACDPARRLRALDLR